MVKTIAQMLWAKKFENNIAKIVKAITRKVKINAFRRRKNNPFFAIVDFSLCGNWIFILTHV